jgi:predicted Zn-dependent protease
LTALPFTLQQLDRYLEGTLELDEILGLSAADVATLRARAQQHLDGRRHERALVALELLAALDRHDPLPALHAVDLLLGLGRSSAAAARARQLHEREPLALHGLVAVAETDLAAGEVRPAAEKLARAVARDPEGRTRAGARARAIAARAHAAVAAG